MRKFLFLSIISICSFLAVSAQYPDPSYETHLHNGEMLFGEGRWRAAQYELSQAAALDEAPDESSRIWLRYMLAECAAQLEEPNALELLTAFCVEYPNSIYLNDVQFASANIYHARGDYAIAVPTYRSVDPYSLPPECLKEYNFKIADSFFHTRDYNNAMIYFRQVDRNSDYGPHADYYMAYIDYIEGNYTAAKRGFAALASHPSYSRIVPFYLLQIEFLEGNYDYVTQNGDALLAVAVGERVAEIARIMGESWFHKGNYSSALEYMERYRASGGEMGREENYIVGYSHYMRNDIGQAVASLTKVSGPDDKLTQNAAYHLGGAYLRAGDKVKAMQSFSMASEAGYDAAIQEDALFNYGKLQYELGGGVFNEAINVLTRYIETYPNSPRRNEATEYLIAAYYNSRNYEAAYDAIKKLPDPDNNIKAAYQKIAYFRAMEFYNNGELDRAYSLLQESLQNRFTPKYTALSQFWSGEILFRKGEYERAVPLFRDYLSVSPPTEREYSMAQYNLGYSYFNRQQWSDARTWFERFLAGYRLRDMYMADANNRLGDISFANREFWKAIESYDAAAAIGTDQKYYSQFRRAMALGFVDRQQRKIESLRGIVERGEGNYVDEALYELGRTYIAADRFSDAVTPLTQFIARYPASDKYAAALSSLGLASQNLGRNSDALKYYHMVVERAPNSPEARDAMISVQSIYIDMNDVDGYFEFAQRSGVESDTGALARDSLTYVAAERIYLQGAAGRDRAIPALEDYLSKFSRGAYRPNALYYLADSYISAGNGSKAVGPLESLADMYYNSFTVRGLERLAPLLGDAGDYEKASDRYLQLARTAVNPATVSKAYANSLDAAARTGDDSRLLTVAEEIVSATAVDGATVRKARFTIAKIASRAGKEEEAMSIYRLLSDEVNSAEGAESKYMVIEELFREGRLDAAQSAVMEFASAGSQQSYWLARSFLVLGDIYILKGDAFQARATLQSIVDGYSPSDDGIIAAARERIEKL